MNGVVTTAPQLGRAAFDGTTGTQSPQLMVFPRCMCDGSLRRACGGAYTRVPPCSTTRLSEHYENAQPRKFLVDIV